MLILDDISHTYPPPGMYPVSLTTNMVKFEESCYYLLQGMVKVTIHFPLTTAPGMLDCAMPKQGLRFGQAVKSPKCI